MLLIFLIVKVPSLIQHSTLYCEYLHCYLCVEVLFMYAAHHPSINVAVELLKRGMSVYHYP